MRQTSSRTDRTSASHGRARRASLVESLEGRTHFTVTGVAGHDLAHAYNTGTVSTTTATYGGTVGVYSHVDDFYKLTVGSTSKVSLALTGLTGNADLQLDDASGNALFFAGNLGTASESITKYLDPGTYYVDVQGYGAASAGYTLSMHNAAISSAEYGHTRLTATNLGTLGINGATLTGSLSASVLDYDWKFTTGGGNFTAVVSGVKPYQGLVEVLNSAGQQVAPTIDPNNPPDPSILQFPTTKLAAGTYTLHLSGQTAATLGFSVKVTAGANAAVKAGGYSAATAVNLGTLSTTPKLVSSLVQLTDPYDYFAVTLASAGTLNLSLSGLSGNAVVQVENASQQLLKQSTYAGAGVTQNLSAALPAGTYYVDVTLGGTVSTPYTLSLSATAGGGTTTGDGNDTPATATPIPTLVNDQFQYVDGSVGGTDLNDYYKFTLTQTTKMTEWLSRTVSGNVHVTLTNSSGTVLDSSNSTLGFNASAAMLDALPAGTYYLNVSPLAGQSTSYRVWFLARAYSDLAGNAASAAYNVGALSSTTRTLSDMIGRVDPSDYYKFTIAATKTVTVAFAGNASLTLYSGNGTTVLASVNSTWSSAGRIAKSLAAGTYYVAVGNTTMDSIYNLYLTAQ